MKRSNLLALISVCFFLSEPLNYSNLAAQQDEIPIKVPDGFVIERFADDDLATNIYSLTVNSRGEVVVAGPGYIKVLLDENGDGKADRFRLFSDSPKQGAQGLFFEGNDLYATGDGGLQFFKDADGNGVADGPPKNLLAVKTGGEHDSHAIRRGPDGWLYVLCGNGVPIKKEYYDGRFSPIKQPRAGFLMRISPDWKQREIVCHGFRNAYDFAFDVQGGVHIYDSDGERDVSMPWYRPTRVFRIRNGDDAGFVTPSWKRPDYFPNMPKVTAKLGRGSPTGVVCYRHQQFPKKYFNSVFALDWTFGRIVSVHRKKDGEYYHEPFAVGQEQFGFAPTDAEVAPDGSLYVSVGGRGTRGGVFRIRYAEKTAAAKKIDDLLIQPLSSWARKKNQPAIDKMTLRNAFEILNAESSDSVTKHRVAEIINEHLRSETTLEILIEQISKQQDAVVATRLCRMLSQFMDERNFANGCISIWSDKKSWQFVIDFQIQLLGTGAISRISQHDKFGSTIQKLRKNAVDDKSTLKYRQIRKLLGMIPFKAKPTRGVFSSYEAELKNTSKRNVGRVKKQLSDFLKKNLAAFSSHDSIVKTEVIRLAAMGQCVPIDQSLSTTAIQAAIAELQDDSNPIQDIHNLACIAVINQQLDEAQCQKISDCIVQLVAKIKKRKLNRDRNWPRHMKDIVTRLVQNDVRIGKALVADRRFANPQNEYLFFVASQLKDKMLKQDVRKRVAEFVKNNPDHVDINNKVLGLIDQQVRTDSELLSALWERKELRPRLVQSLTVRANAVHRDKYIIGLQMADPQTTRRCAMALTELGLRENAMIVTHAVRVLVRMGWDRKDQPIREQMIGLLRQQTRKQFGFQFGERGRNAQSQVIAKWMEYAKQNHAETFGQVFRNADVAAWTSKTLAKVDWAKGDISRGKKLYQALSCARCHDGARALGPRLQGITRRFNRADLFKTITQPDEQVSSRYRTVVIETTSGRIYKGIVVYESVDGLTLVDEQNQTVRIEANEIDYRQSSTSSLMPSGLMDKTKSQDWADLYEYLKTLK